MRRPRPSRSATLEHIPVHAYELLRRVSEARLPVDTLHGRQDEYGLEFLLSRGLVEKTGDGGFFELTVAGSELGEIAAETGPTPATMGRGEPVKDGE
jgi:hypothetical protein